MSSENVLWNRLLTFDDLKKVLPVICELASKHEHIRICHNVVDNEMGVEVGEEYVQSDSYNDLINKMAEQFLKERRSWRALK